MITRPLPRDANAVIDRHLADCRNLGLVLDKFQPWQPVNENQPGGMWKLLMRIDERKKEGDKYIWKSGAAEDSAARGLWFNGSSDESRLRLNQPTLAPNSHIDSDAWQSFMKRWRSSLPAVNAEPFAMWTESPLILGLGAKGTLETALTLHPLYGFPYLPGSALKGIARAAAFFALAAEMSIDGVDNETFADLRKKKEKTPLQKLAEMLDEKLDDKDTAKWPADYRPFEVAIRRFRCLFGWRGAAGWAVFLDGVPARVPAVVSEVMTPHFKSYYDGRGSPHDADSPNPISLLAVARRTPFAFAVGLRHGDKSRCLQSGETDEDLRRAAILWLAEGLENLGLGGKTASGYGFFVEKDPGPAATPVKRAEADVSGYHPPAKIAATPAAPSGGPVAPVGDEQPQDKPEDNPISREAKEFAANLARLAAEAEAREKARLARKEEKKKKGKKR